MEYHTHHLPALLKLQIFKIRALPDAATTKSTIWPAYVLPLILSNLDYFSEYPLRIISTDERDKETPTVSDQDERNTRVRCS
jgi:hypothetical protein